ncbi:MAG: hypothetical protein RL653_3316 [Pseudomonadota bacterium]
MGEDGVTFSGYVEGYVQWNVREPADGLTRLRGFDNRHASLTLSNAALGASWKGGRGSGKLLLQVGATPSSYYLSEPSLPGAPGANGSSAALWQFLQEAWGAYRVDVGPGVTVSAGLFTSPIGPEVVPVRDNWNWSRSNLFFGLPYYHAGVTAAVPVGRGWTATAGVFNGWNAVVDSNPEKTVMLRTHSDAASPLALSFLYMGGVERPAGAPEGRPFRHLLDAHATWLVLDRLSLIAHVDLGGERNRFGLSGWAAAALSARWAFSETLSLAARADGFREWRARDGEGTAEALFWPVPWVASGTVTLDFHPEPSLSIRLEGRHDHAGGDVYGTQGAGVLRPVQDTVTLGLVAGF